MADERAATVGAPLEPQQSDDSRLGAAARQRALDFSTQRMAQAYWEAYTHLQLRLAHMHLEELPCA